jgi:hypothetical protein
MSVDQVTSGLASTPRRFLARVERWQAPPRNLLLTALVLLVFPWDDVLIDAAFAAVPKLPAVGVYLVWILFECTLIWVVLATGGLSRQALVYAGITAVLGSMLAAVYYWVREYSALYMVAIGVLDIAYVALITVVMRVRLNEGSSSSGWFARWFGLGRPTGSVGPAATERARLEQPIGMREVPLFNFVIPLIVSIAIAYAASFFADLTCARHAAHAACTYYGPHIALGFFDQTAHIIAVLLVALAIEARLLVGPRGHEEGALVSVTIIGLAVGIAASLTASAAHAESLPLTFPLTVQALALALMTILMLPSLRTAS